MKKYQIHLLCLLGVLLMGFNLKAQRFQFKDHRFTEYFNIADVLNTVSQPDTIKVEHDKWSDMVNNTSWSNDYSIKSVHNLVKFYVTYDSNTVNNKYTYNLPVTILAWSNPATPSTYNTLNDTLVISYNPDSLEVYQDRFNLKYAGYHKMWIIINDIYLTDYSQTPPTLTALPNPVPTTYAPSSTLPGINCRIEGEIWLQRYDKLSNTNLTVSKNTNNVSTEGKLRVEWTTSTSTAIEPASYQLEWVYIDDYKITDYSAGTYSTKALADLDYDFAHNSTRVVTNSMYYDIPLIYNRGYIAYRARMVRPDETDYDTPIYGAWSVTAATGSLSSLGSGNYYYHSTAHKSDSINWNFTISYAEEGKNKNVLSYFDGSLKNRQSLTQFNSVDNRLIVAQSIYDYEGRPAISMLPTPVVKSKLNYVENFAMNNATSAQYEASDFDTGNGCPESVPENLHSNALGNKYYSTNNPNKTGLQQFVPDANSYPFVYTIVSPENSSKVLKQGGAGEILQIGKGHETIYEYVSPMQTEVNRLFGSEVGYSEYYNKTVSTDPNGQSSYVIKNYKDQVMATGMLGSGPDTSVHPVNIFDTNSDTSSYTEDLIYGTNSSFVGDKLTLHKNFYADLTSNNYTAQYEFSYDPYPLCVEDSVYLTVAANYKYWIFDDCGNNKLSENASASSSGLLYSAPSPTVTSVGILNSFSLTKGKHFLNKQLELDKSGIADGIDAYIASNPSCLYTEDYFIRNAVEDETFPCPAEPFEPCKSKKLLMMLQMWPHSGKYGHIFPSSSPLHGNDSASSFSIYYFSGGTSYPVSTSTTYKSKYVTYSTHANGPNGPSYTIYYFYDTQEGGTATIDTVFHNAELPNDTLASIVYIDSIVLVKNPIPGGVTPDSVRYRYQLCDGLSFPDPVAYKGNNYSNIQQLPVDTFIKIFNLDIAEALLPLHPEYCKLNNCLLLNDQYADTLMSLPDVASAKSASKFFLDDIIQNDPLYIASAISYDSLRYFKGGGLIPIDSIALGLAYCAGVDTFETDKCFSTIFQTEIAAIDVSGASDDVQAAYMEQAMQMYIANRETRIQDILSGTQTSCGPCSTWRMSLVPMPIFPSADSTSVVQQFNSSQNGLNNSNMPGNTNNAVVSALTQTLATNITQATATSLYNTTMVNLCDSILNHTVTVFENCSTNPLFLPALKTAMSNYYCHGSGFGKEFTPYIVDSILSGVLATYSMSKSDLCNPYLFDYRPSPIPILGHGDKLCKNSVFLDDVKTFFNKSRVYKALTNSTLETVPISGSTNLFESEIANITGQTTSVEVEGSYNSTDKRYLLTINPSGASNEMIKVWLQRKTTSGDCSYALDQLDTWEVSSVNCIQTAYDNVPNARINELSFDMTWKITKNADVSYCNVLGWNDQIDFLEQPTAQQSALLANVNCLEYKELFKDLQDSLDHYELAHNHPNYYRFIGNFMNYRLKKDFLWDDYEEFISSCAISDTLMLRSSYCHYELSSTNSLAPLISDLSTNFGITYGDFLRYDVGSTKYLLLNFNAMSYGDLLALKKHLNSYGGVSGLNKRYMPVYGLDTLAGMLVPTANPLPGGFGASTFADAGDVSVSSSTSATIYHSATLSETFDLYTITKTSSSLAPALCAQYIDSLSSYIYNQTPMSYVLKANNGFVHEDYYKEEKEDFLSYQYGLSFDQRSDINVRLAEDSLKEHITSYASEHVSYDHPAIKNLSEDLYVSDSSQTAYPGYDMLSNILNSTATVNSLNSILPNSLFGSLAPATSGMNPMNAGAGSGYSYKVYNCGDRTTWYYRYFDEHDALFNIFIQVPEHIYDPEDYNYMGFTVGPGDSSAYRFTVHMQKPAQGGNPAHDISCYGFTDFSVGKTLKLDRVFLQKGLFDPIEYRDTMNCERQRLEAAITLGKQRYAIYIDSVRNSLIGKAWDYISNSVSETFTLKATDQKYHFTLYYYDRAGNLVHTISPSGVNRLSSNTTAQTAVNGDREDFHMPGFSVGANDPAHTKKTVYHYNSLNQPIYQNTPDGGETHFYYDLAGRLVFSQNDKQKAANKYSYTLYDKQSRIAEVGEFVHKTLTIDPIIEKSSEPQYHNQIESFILSHPRMDVTATVYDNEALDLSAFDNQNAQDNLRKRVSCVKVFKLLPPSLRGDAINSYDFATHYSYDISGNVKNLVQDFYFLPIAKQRFKRIDYDYDLYSGKVNMVSYNRGMTDQFYQRYEYDEDNRITKAETSPDAIYWDEDANYKYYEHGPLARTGIGDLKVQAIDYAYTIQGWLKAMNGAVLDTTYDMSHDGSRTVYARDMMGLTLDYFKHDYKAIDVTDSVSQIDPVALNQNLYNGNIVRQNLSLDPLPYLSKQYKYDPLNRISEANYYEIDKNNSNALVSTDHYKSSYTYDGDGNIEELVRNGNNPSALLMDTMRYLYDAGHVNNKLRDVEDHSANNYGTKDIQQHTTSAGDRLFYDEIGNLIKDNINGNDTILWNLYGKVREVRNADSSRILFSYDGAGHRIHKAVLRTSNDTTFVSSEYYVRDASGNILSILKSHDVYDQVSSSYMQHAVPYGVVAANATVSASLQSNAGNAWIGASLLQGSAANTTFRDSMINAQTSSFFLNDPNILGALLHTSMDYQEDLFDGSDTLLQKALVLDPYNLFDGLAYNQTTFTEAMEELCTASDTTFDVLMEALAVPDTLGCAAAASAMGDTLVLRRQYVVNAAALVFANDTNMTDQEKLDYVYAAMDNETVFNTTVQNQLDHWKSPMAEAMHKKFLADTAYASTLQTVFNNRAEILPEIKSNLDNDVLLAKIYNNNPSQFYTGFVNSVGSSALGAALNNNPMLSVRGLMNTVSGAYGNTAALQAYEDVHLAMDYNLAEHHLYGSSRLGIKSYWPGQVGYIWANGDPVNHVDSAQINATKPWYHYNQNEFIEQLALTPLVPADYDDTHWNSHRILGQKQYELVNHLGNVQLTALDRITPIKYEEDNDTIDTWYADASNVYDHYPFGMYMPGRVLGDDVERCADVTYYQYIPTKVSKTYWNTSNGSTTTGVTNLGSFYATGASGGTLSQYESATGFQYNSDSREFGTGGVSYTFATQNETSMTASLTVEPIDNEGNSCSEEITIRIMAVHTNGSLEELTSATIEGTGGEYSLDYTAITDSTALQVVSISPRKAFWFTTSSWTIDEIHYTQQQVTKTFCSGDDKYRFGFNGQEKDNEVAGKGNSMTAQFWKYDTRLARRSNLDPVDQINISNYAVNGLNPIYFSDPHGNTKKSYKHKISAVIKSIFSGGGGKTDIDLNGNFVASSGDGGKKGKTSGGTGKGIKVSVYKPRVNGSSRTEKYDYSKRGPIKGKTQEDWDYITEPFTTDHPLDFFGRLFKTAREAWNADDNEDGQVVKDLGEMGLDVLGVGPAANFFRLARAAKGYKIVGGVNLTNGKYIVNRELMKKHVTGGFTGKSIFYPTVDADAAVLRAAEFADDTGAWIVQADGSAKAKITVLNTMIGTTGSGKPTNVINVMKGPKGEYIHGTPGNIR